MKHDHSVAAEQISELFPVVWRELDCRVAAGRDR